MKSMVFQVAVLSLFFQSSVFAGSFLDDLTGQQLQDVREGKQVFVVNEVRDYPWPEAYIYRKVAVTPEEATAVFVDFNIQKNYVPNLLRSRIKANPKPHIFEVDYELDLPWPVSNENYLVEDILSTYMEGQSYQVDWDLIEADSTEEIMGNIRFEPFEGGAVMRYYNFIVPGSSMAGWFRDKALTQVQDTAKAIALEAEKEKQHNPGLLARQIENLRKALSPEQVDFLKLLINRLLPVQN